MRAHNNWAAMTADEAAEVVLPTEQEIAAKGPVDVNVSPVLRWTGTMTPNGNGSFVAYSEYLRLVECAMQALWHIGTDADRNMVSASGHGWETDRTEAANMLRMELDRANVK